MSDVNPMGTFTGRKFFPLSPSAADVSILDIARSLSQTCRFRGHTLHYYSVAQHCLNVVDCLPPELKLWGLLHDAAEAYLVDAQRPLKRHLVGFSELENAVLQQVAKRYGLAWPMPIEVAEADDRVLAAEATRVMRRGYTLDEVPDVEPFHQGNYRSVMPLEAERLFIHAFLELCEAVQ